MSCIDRIEDLLDIGERRELGRVLGTIFGRQTEKFRITYVGQGQNYLIFRAEADELIVCVRIGNVGKEECFAELNEALSICEKNNIVTNRVLFYDFSCRKIHRPYMITTFICGSTYNINEVQEVDMCQFFFDFGIYLARLHSIKYPYFLKKIRTKNRLDIRKYLSARYMKLYESLKCEKIQIELNNLNEIYYRLYNAIDFESIVPRFVHRDISMSNLIINNGRFQCLIDFEHAIFFDSIWDFVKLELNILSKLDPMYRECFLKSYRSIIPLEQEIDGLLKYSLYYMLELMWAIVNDYNDSRNLYLDMLNKFVRKEVSSHEV